MGVPVASLCMIPAALLSAAAQSAYALGPHVQAPVPAFPIRSEVITVDALVLDKQGRSVTGLSKVDFIVREDGVAQEITAFLAVDTASAASQAANSQPPSAVAADLAGVPPQQHYLAIVIDDEGLDVRGGQAVSAVRRWLREQADPRSHLTVATTSGKISWSGLLEEGKGQLLRTLEGLRYLRPKPSFFGLTEWQAYRIQEGFGAGRGIEWDLSIRVLDEWHRRKSLVVEFIESYARSHSDIVGRKPIYLFMQGFVDEEDDLLVARAIDASRRANAPLYFIDPRGLVAGETDGSNVFGDNMQEVSRHIDMAGAEELAKQTGGALLQDNNDIFGGLTRLVNESRVYYLLGYQPQKPPDGRWRKVEVRVKAKGVRVRARQGYVATVAPAP